MTDLPDGWESLEVKEVVTEIKSGFASGKHNASGSGVPHLRPMNVSRVGRIDLAEVKYVEDDSDRRLRRWDVLFNNTNSPDLVGKTALVNSDEDLAFSNHMTRLRADTERVLPSFLAIQLHANWHSGYFKSICSNHVNQASISGKRLSTVRIAIPDIGEQEEIIRILDTQLARLDTVLEAVQTVRDKADQFRRSLLHAAFTGQLTHPDPRRMTDLPEGWTSCLIADLAGTSVDSLFSDGDWVESKDQDPDGTIRLTQLADVGEATFRDRSDRWLNVEQATRLGVTYLEEGDLLIARMPDPLGRCCRVPTLPYEAVTVVDVAVLRVTEANPEFVMHMINSPEMRRRINEQSSGTTRKRISRKRLGALQFPVPPSVEQEEIVRILDTQLARLDKALEVADRVEVECGRLRRSLLRAAFTGELTKKWREANV